LIVLILYNDKLALVKKFKSRHKMLLLDCAVVVCMQGTLPLRFICFVLGL
jgi:hypothetical protein